MRIIAIAMLLTLASCATGYKPKGLFNDGYSERRVSSDMFVVRFSGNGYTSSTTVQDYLLKRCAELTLLNGYTHFVVLGSGGDTSTSYHSNFQSNPYGVTGNTYAINKHTGEATIRMINNPLAGQVAYDAEMIFGPLQKREAASLPSSKTIDEMK